MAKGKDHGLGRLHAPDMRDLNYPARTVLPRLTVPADRPARYWNDQGWWGDQGSTGTCVAFSGAHLMEDGPITHRGEAPLIKPFDLYDAAIQVDEWHDNDNDRSRMFGTSVRAAAKVLQARGLISEYRWVVSGDPWEVANAVYNVTPVWVGFNWYEDFFSPNSKGFVEPSPSGAPVGGHAFLVNGVNVPGRFFRCKNSWGRKWGRTGRFFMSFDLMGRLLQEDGEACIVVEPKTKAAHPPPAEGEA